MHSNVLDRISFWSLFLVVVLLPVFFLPFTKLSVETGKGFFFAIGLIISIIFWIVARFSDGKVSLPRSLPLLAGGGVVLVFLFSAFFSGTASQISFFGIMFDIGTFWFIFSAFLILLMSSIIFGEPKNARMLLFGILLSSTVLLLFQGLHLFVPNLSLSVLAGKTDNILGSWNGLGIFAGFYALSALFAIEFFPLVKKAKLVLGALVIFSLLFIAVVNFILVWEILGVFALLIFVYKVSTNSSKRAEGEKMNFPTFSFIIVLVSLLFITSGQFIGGFLPGKLGISNNEVSPSFIATMSVTKSVLTDHPLLGIGPNRFDQAWAMYRPAVINQTAFWDVVFNSGSGLLPTLTATTGWLGILAWLLFFFLFIAVGIKSLFSSIKNSVGLETVSFFLLSLYLFCASFFYATGTVLFLMAMIFGGVFIGLVASSHKNGEISISFFDDHRKSFFFLLLLVLLLIVSAATGFNYIQRFASVSFFSKTLVASNIADAEFAIGKTLALNSNDLYFRTYSQIYLAKLNSIASKESSSLSDTDKANLQTSLDQAINAARLAITYNPKNYLNFQMLGSVFQTAGLIGVKDAYGKALETYQTASTLNPLNPGIKLAIASVYSAMGDAKAAKDYANQALTLKPDYIDALITLSQLAKSEGDYSAALSYAQTALSYAPADSNLIKYIDSLKGTPGSVPTPPPAKQ